MVSQSRTRVQTILHGKQGAFARNNYLLPELAPHRDCLFCHFGEWIASTWGNLHPHAPHAVARQGASPWRTNHQDQLPNLAWPEHTLSPSVPRVNEGAASSRAASSKHVLGWG